MISYVAELMNRCTKEELSSANYGSYPQDFEQIVPKYMSRMLKDPMSAQYQYWGKPTQAWSSVGGRKFGHVVCADINAKNAFGGYVGAKPYYFMIKDGAVIEHHGGDSDWDQAFAKTMCDNVAKSGGW